MQIERAKRLYSFALVGPRHHGIASDGEQGAHLAIALKQHLVGEGAGGRLAMVDVEVAHALRSTAVQHVRHRRIHLSPNRR